MRWCRFAVACQTIAADPETSRALPKTVPLSARLIPISAGALPMVVLARFFAAMPEAPPARSRQFCLASVSVYLEACAEPSVDTGGSNVPAPAIPPAVALRCLQYDRDVADVTAFTASLGHV